MRKTLSPKSKDSSVPPGEAPKEKPQRYVPRGGSEKNRLLIAIDDGQIDFHAMGPEAAKTFNDLMHTPEVQAQFGIGPLAQTFDPQHCKRFYEAFGRILQSFGKLALHWPDEALKQLEYSESEKDELAEPTARAMDEIAPRWLKENQAVAAFFLLFATITQQKLQMAAMEASRMKQEKSKKDRVTTVIPLHVPGAPVSTQN
jgi:hypothetical protein